MEKPVQFPRVRMFGALSAVTVLMLVGATPSPAATATKSANNPFPSGYCTWGAWNLAPWLGSHVRGNAGRWYDAAKGKLPTGTTPVVGAVFVKTTNPGHVGIVTKVINKTMFKTKEMNGGTGGSWANDFKTSEFNEYREHTQSTGPNMKFIYKPGTEPGSLSKYVGHIVQWSGDKKAQKTAWLVGPDLKRRWIPDIATYQCLKAQGAPGPTKLPASTLDKLKDLRGVHAKCTPPAPESTTAAPPPPPPPPPKTSPPPKKAPPPPPPKKTVSLAKGASAQGLSGCSSSYCRFLSVSFKNFSSGTHTIVCRASGGYEGGFYTYTRSGSSGSSSYCYYGFPGRTVWVTVDGVASNKITW